MDRKKDTQQDSGSDENALNKTASAEAQCTFFTSLPDQFKV